MFRPEQKKDRLLHDGKPKAAYKVCQRQRFEKEMVPSDVSLPQSVNWTPYHAGQALRLPKPLPTKKGTQILSRALCIQPVIVEMTNTAYCGVAVTRGVTTGVAPLYCA